MLDLILITDHVISRLENRCFFVIIAECSVLIMLMSVFKYLQLLSAICTNLKLETFQ